jgi:hypothetical protein
MLPWKSTQGAELAERNSGSALGSRIAAFGLHLDRRATADLRIAFDVAKIIHDAHPEAEALELQVTAQTLGKSQSGND